MQATIRVDELQFDGDVLSLSTTTARQFKELLEQNAQLVRASLTPTREIVLLYLGVDRSVLSLAGERFFVISNATFSLFNQQHLASKVQPYWAAIKDVGFYPLLRNGTGRGKTGAGYFLAARA